MAEWVGALTAVVVGLVAVFVRLAQRVSRLEGRQEERNHSH